MKSTKRSKLRAMLLFLFMTYNMTSLEIKREENTLFMYIIYIKANCFERVVYLKMRTSVDGVLNYSTNNSSLKWIHRRTHINGSFTPLITPINIRSHLELRNLPPLLYVTFPVSQTLAMRMSLRSSAAQYSYLQF